MSEKVNRIHCSYHKCLTVYYGKTMRDLYNKRFRRRGGYRHFNSSIDDFYQYLPDLYVASVNNHYLDRDRLGNYRISRFVRDPRDLVISGYFYHRCGAEDWCTIKEPKESDWAVVNGCLPAAIRTGESFAECLGRLPQEDGLIAEIDFRYNHFRSMAQWPTQDPRILLFKYEDILGNEQQVFSKLLKFYEVPWLERFFGARIAVNYSAGRQKKGMRHIRNPEPQQWKKYFTPKVEAYFMDAHGALLKQLGYQ